MEYNKPRGTPATLLNRHVTPRDRKARLSWGIMAVMRTTQRQQVLADYSRKKDTRKEVFDQVRYLKMLPEGRKM